MKYSVDSVVCDYGVFEDGKLKLICNSRRNALLILAIMEKDDLCNYSEYVFENEDFNKFMDKWCSDINFRSENSKYHRIWILF